MRTGKRHLNYITQIIIKPPMREAMDKYTDLSLMSANNAFKTSMRMSEGIFRNSMIVVGLMMISILAGGMYLRRSINKPLSEAMEIVDRMAEGDLRIHIDRSNYNPKDAIGFLLHKMYDMHQSQKQVIEAVKNGAAYISQASIELNQSAEQLSEGVNLQASSVEQISTSMDEMTTNIMHNASNANQTEKIADSSNTQVEASNQSVQKTVEAMGDIVNKNSIIEEIARQTNLLALNAAVEAARAGEHGKGFAVVAAEIRKLAEKSQNAAKEIQEISGSSEKVARMAGQMLTTLVSEIGTTSTLVSEISVACNEQQEGAHQINTAIRQFNIVVQQNASSAEQLAANSDELNKQSKILQEAVSFFTLDEKLTYSEFDSNFGSM
ncbi:methyl-accepting chemotaxis protein [Fulvivirga ligni]|uniref:methyl-accepting chemotaxis protein n=1 Tax=Fulvivirga ligni TaxID=2904246 RepID=UPI001F20D4E6|nr:methyl-accepting chemotaxis protein [Fulvivirga ligni]UII19663.1 methyl-accepting chemotaxis protein [Fulvivirga ligni]